MIRPCCMLILFSLYRFCFFPAFFPEPGNDTWYGLFLKWWACSYPSKYYQGEFIWTDRDRKSGAEQNAIWYKRSSCWNLCIGPEKWWTAEEVWEDSERIKNLEPLFLKWIDHFNSPDDKAMMKIFWINVFTIARYRCAADQAVPEWQLMQNRNVNSFKNISRRIHDDFKISKKAEQFFDGNRIMTKLSGHGDIKFLKDLCR